MRFSTTSLDTDRPKRLGGRVKAGPVGNGNIKEGQQPMKISDIIFQFKTRNGSGHDGICRVRIFVSEQNKIIALLTDLGPLSMGPSVTNFVEVIRTALIERGLISDDAIIIEHYEKSEFRAATLDLVSFSCDGRPNWKSLTLIDAISMLSCDPIEFEGKTIENIRLRHEIARIRNAINPFIDSPHVECPEIIKRRLEIQSKQITKAQLQNVIEAGSIEQDIQRLLKSDLSIIAEVYANPKDEYICFSEFPIGNGAVDFALFTGCSRMDVILIEVKGADFNLINSDSYANFSQKFNESVKQIQKRLGLIYDDGLKEFRRKVHAIRDRVESGESMYNSFIGPCHKLEVSPEKEINIRCVVIGGRTQNDIEESKHRHNYERTFVPPIKVESWDSWLTKLRR